MYVMGGRERKGMQSRLGLAAALAVGVMALLSSGVSWAFLDTGTLLTNAASATYMAGSQGTSVTYSATAKILIANPAVYVWKDGSPTYVATAGGLVRFTICFSNGGANSAFNMLIYDHLPPNTAVYGNCSAADYQGYAVGTTLTMQYGGSINGPWTTGCPPVTTTSPWLRWQVGMLGIGTTGCISFNATISP
jgi:uncharacterized repeat protein (TIGR01451 family)